MQSLSCSPLSAHLKVVVGSLQVILELELHVLGLDELHAGLVVVVLQGSQVLQQLLAVLLVLVGDQFLLVKLQGQPKILVYNKIFFSFSTI